MEKYSAEQSYQRMAEFVVESGITDPRQVTSSIAKAAGVSFEAVSKWKDGRTKAITLLPINRFCEKYKASPDYISSGTGPKYRLESYSPEEQEILQLFGQANRDDRRTILKMLRGLTETGGD